jgi:phage tail sheath protein FI
LTWQPEGAHMTYLSPGVYVEEVESGSRPIEGVGTSIAAFVGLAPGGPLDSPALRVAAGVGFLALVVLIVRHRRVS